MTRPTPGRIVLVYPSLDHYMADFPPEPAIVARVVDDRTVNLAVFNYAGDLVPKLNVPFLEDPSVQSLADETRAFATWMHYQREQAAKVEEPKLTQADVCKIIAEQLKTRDEAKVYGPGVTETHFAGVSNVATAKPPLDLAALAKGGAKGP